MKIRELRDALSTLCGEGHGDRTVVFALYDVEAETIEVGPVRVLCLEPNGKTVALAAAPEVADWYSDVRIGGAS
jgi:hypothetical protein